MTSQGFPLDRTMIPERVVNGTPLPLSEEPHSEAREIKREEERLQMRRSCSSRSFVKTACLGTHTNGSSVRLARLSASTTVAVGEESDVSQPSQRGRPTDA